MSWCERSKIVMRGTNRECVRTDFPTEPARLHPRRPVAVALTNLEQELVDQHESGSCRSRAGAASRQRKNDRRIPDAPDAGTHELERDGDCP